MANTTNVPTEINANHVKMTKLTAYIVDGVKYATAANWRLMGLQPTANAVETVVTSKLGHNFSIYAESQTEQFDAKAHAEATEKRKELKKQQSELFKLYMKHEIGLADYTVAMAEIEKQLA